MNWIDLLIIIVLMIFIFEGIGKSFYYELIDLTAFALAFVFSLSYYNLLAVYLKSALVSIPYSLVNVISFFLTWFIVETAVIFFLRLIFNKLNFKIYTFSDRLLGFIPSFLRGLIFISVLLVLLATFPIQPKIKSEVKSSLIGAFILDYTYYLERPLKSVFGGLANDTLTFLTIKPKSNESVALGFTTTNFKFNPESEQKMIELVNKERTSRGLKILTFDTNLQQIGRNHSADMFTKGYFAHRSPAGKTVADRAHNIEYRFYVIGENLAYAPSLDLAHQGLMNSEGHKANILSPDYNKIGIGAAVTSDLGIMFTQVFSD